METLKAIYNQQPNCALCIDVGMKPESFTCTDCMEIHQEEVEIIELGVGLFADKAIIKKLNGKLDTVSINTLTIKE